MTDQTDRLLRDAENYLSALHGSVARHDNLAENYACAGCELRDAIRAALAAPAAVVSPPATPAATPSRRAGLRDLIRRAVCEAEGFAWDSDTLEPDEYGEVADTVLAVLYAEWPWLRAEAEDAAPDDGDRRDRYADAIHDAMEADLSLVDQEPGTQALFSRAAEAAVTMADTELAEARARVAELEQQQTGQRAADRQQIIETLYEARSPGLGGMTEAEAVALMADAVLRRLADETPAVEAERTPE